MIPLFVWKMFQEGFHGVLTAPNYPSQALFGILVSLSSNMILLGADGLKESLWDGHSDIKLGLGCGSRDVLRTEWSDVI